MKKHTQKANSNFRDFVNISKFSFLQLWRNKSVLFWSGVLPFALIVILSTALPNGGKAIGLRIGLMISITMMTINILPNFIGNLRISNSFVQFKLSGYKERIVLCAMSFTLLLFLWIVTTLAIIVTLIANGGVGFLQTAYYYAAPISMGHAWLNLLSTYLFIIFASIVFVPIGWLIASFGTEARSIGMITTLSFTLILVLSGTYFNYQTIHDLHQGGWKILGDILYILPTGAVFNLLGLTLGMNNQISGKFAWTAGISDDPLIVSLQIISLILTIVLILWGIKKFFKFSN